MAEIDSGDLAQDAWEFWAARICFMCGVVAAAVLLALNIHLLATAGSHIAHFALNSTLAACLAVERAERVSESTCLS